MMPTPLLLRWPLVALLGLGVQAVSAQTTLRGRVVDSELGYPLVGATVRFPTGATFTSDSSGRFQAPGVAGGRTEIRIEQLGYASEDFVVMLPASGTVQAEFALDFTGVNLSEIVVEARAEQLMPRYLDFERRRERKLGGGAFLRWDELKKAGAASVGDALRTVRGVRISCVQESFECFAVMVRTPGCQPTWFIDGVQVRSFHENTPIRDIYGIEIYRGAGEIPAEFAGSNAACGVIVLWTKSRPYR